MKLLLATVLSVIAFSSGMVMASQTDITMTDLLTYRQQALDDLYTNSHPGPIPDGNAKGKAIFFPGTTFARLIAKMASIFWQGKIFDFQEKMVINKVLGFRAIKAKVFFGKSWLDEKESVIIDYQDTSLVAFPVRDEIREIAPGIYLGRAYARTIVGPILGVNFALDFNRGTN